MPAKRDRRAFVVSAVIVLSRIYAFVNLYWTKYSTFVYYDFTTNGEGEHGAATAHRKLEPDGGSPNKYELGKRKPLGAGSTRRQEMG